MTTFAGDRCDADKAGSSSRFANVIYVPGTLAVTLDGLRMAILKLNVDLNQLLQLDAGRAYVGFTAATGAAFERHDITYWDIWTFWGHGCDPFSHPRPDRSTDEHPTGDHHLASRRNRRLATGFEGSVREFGATARSAPVAVRDPRDSTGADARRPLVAHRP